MEGLMATKSITGEVRSTELEARLGTTIMGGYVNEIDNFFKSIFGQEKNVSLPTLGYLFEIIPELKEKMISKYNMEMGLEKGVEDIPEDLKASQGALLDGLCFGYDVNETDPSKQYALYTLNFKLLTDMGVDSIDKPGLCMKQNEKGLVKGYRIDVEYNSTPESFSFKAVNHRKAIDDDKEVLLIPYLAVLRLMLIIENFINSGMVLKLSQDLEGLEKVRCVTTNRKVLKAFSDSPDVVDSLESAFFPLRAFFYAPVIGAPSTTAMVTNINLFALDEMKKLRSMKDIRALGVEKSENPVYDVMLDVSISTSLMKIKSENPERFVELLKGLPKSDKYLNITENGEGIGGATISKYLHSLKNKEKNAVLKKIPEAQKKMEVLKDVGTESRSATSEELKNLKSVLRTSLCKILIRKKDCKLSTVFGTNSPNILQSVYGKDYFAQYEGFNLRFDRLLRYLSMGRPVEIALKENGFQNDEDILKKIEEITKAGAVDKESFAEALKTAVAEREGVKTRAKSSTNNILVRLLNAYITEDGTVEDYYRFVDESKIISVQIYNS